MMLGKKLQWCSGRESDTIQASKQARVEKKIKLESF